MGGVANHDVIDVDPKILDTGLVFEVDPVGGRVTGDLVGALGASRMSQGDATTRHRAMIRLQVDAWPAGPR